MYKLFGYVGIFLLLSGMGAMSLAVDAGVMFQRKGQEGKHLYHEKVPNDAAHQFYGTLEGPSWENKYCTWRTYIDQDNRNCIDLTAKKKYEPTLLNYDKSTTDVHADNPWGTDIFEVGTTAGLGAFRIQYGDATWRNPELGVNLDSMVVDIIDSTYDSPRLRIAYWGWKITSTAKIDALWTIATKEEMHATMCELVIQGKDEDYDKIKVVVGMTKASGTSGTKLTQDTLKRELITLGKQSQQGDSLLLAMQAHSAYFSSFSSNSTNYAMILKLNANHKVKWNFMYSWGKEPSPLFRESDWQSKLFNDLPSPEAEDTISTTYIGSRGNPASFQHWFSQNFNNNNGKGMIFDLSGKTIRNNIPASLVTSYLSHRSPGIYFFRQHMVENMGKEITGICTVKP